MRTFPCKIAGSTLTVTDLPSFKSYIERLRDGYYMLSFSRAGETRSERANSYYWAALAEVAEHAGYDDPKELHVIFRAKFLGRKDENGLPHVGSTSKLTDAEFAEYIRKIDVMCLEVFGCGFPLPEGYGE